jgi:glycosyltransferase involved in cell wall biosynthesis
MRLTIVADWLTTFGGAEHVLAALHDLFPSAPFFTTVARPPSLGSLQKATIHPDSFLQMLYKWTKNHQILLPLMPRAIEQINLDGYDVILSSSHAVAKGIVPPQNAIHICYCHTPMRYAWEMEEEYLRDFRIPWILKNTVKRMLKKLRRWDLSTAQRVDYFIANSTEAQRRIKKIYGRESVVISPPVDARFFQCPHPEERGGTTNYQLPTTNYFLAVGRLVPYKRFDLLIDVCNRLALPLKIIGRGSDEKRLKALAGPTVEFLGFVPDEDLPSLYAHAQALLFPQIEDAGIVPMEAQACGTPVIAYARGGILDVIKEGCTGVLVHEQTVEAFMNALQSFDEKKYDPLVIREHARQFHIDEFKKKIEEEIQERIRKK